MGSIQMISDYIICYYFEYKKQDYSAVLIGQALLANNVVQPTYTICSTGFFEIR